MLAGSPTLPEFALAIVGMAGQFPGARNVDQLWHNLATGVKSIRLFRDQELLQAGVDPRLLRDPHYVRAGTLLDGIELFDAPFFGFTPREAETMDPQSRLFLHCAWTALEDAGYDPATYQGLIGIFAGKHPSLYAYNLYSNPDIVQRVGMLQIATGNDADALAAMTAYKLDLRGPSISVQTFCSTSLVAVHLACQSLLACECDIALAGGVAVRHPQVAGYLYQEGGILSPDGECRALDAGARGTVFGNGLAVVVLKRLEDALKDGDHLYALIRGSATSNDGIGRAGFTAPGVEGQAAVIAAALANAGVEAETIGYIETHGTGTLLGDSVELRAMIRAFQHSTDKVQFCAIGSHKPNVGHLDRASGVTGLIVATLALHHKLLPPSLNFERPNPEIDLQHSPFYVNTTLAEWSPNATWPRRAGVSSFGLGGTNVHLVLESAPELEPSGPSRPAQLLLLSAKTQSALHGATANLLARLQEKPPGDNLADVAHTLQVGRAAFNYRRMVVCHDVQDAVAALSERDPRRVFTLHQTYRDRPVVFVFAGVGDHYVHMASELYQVEPVFREWVDRCCELLRPDLGFDLREVLYPEGDGQAPFAIRHSPFAIPPHEGDPPKLQTQNSELKTALDLRRMLEPEDVESPLQRTELAQPAVFVIEVALAQLLISWGIRPRALIGYSLGEYVAACVAGVLSLDDALRLVVGRAHMIQGMEAGAMLTVSLSHAQLQPLLDGRIALAAVLAPNVCVVGGPVGEVSRLKERLAARAINCRRLPTTHAFHTPMLEPIVDDYAALVRSVRLNAPQIPYLSNVTGDWITADQVTDPAYWTEHLCATVQLASGIGVLLQDKGRLLLEVGPGQSIGSFVRQHPHCTRQQFGLLLPTLRHAHDRQSDLGFLLDTLGRLWLAGVEIDWARYGQHEQRYRVSLPTYPFDLSPYWIEPQVDAREGTDGAPVLPPSPVLGGGVGGEGSMATSPRAAGKKADIGQWFYQPLWKQTPAWSPSHAQALDPHSRWLVFMDGEGCASLIAQRLEKTCRVVARLWVGEQFEQLGENNYRLNPRKAGDIFRLFNALPCWPTHIAHLWGVNALGTSDPPEKRFDHAQYLGFYSLLFLVKVLSRYTEDLRIWVTTSGAQLVVGNEALCPAKATLLGACRVIPQEHPNITCHHVDIAWPQDSEWQAEWLAGQLVAEFAADPGARGADALAVAYRGGMRWEQVYEPLYLGSGSGDPSRTTASALRRRGVYADSQLATPDSQLATSALRPRGVYLIAGGLGEVGMILARHLAESAQARVILTTRSAFPPREAWSSWLESHRDHDDKTSAKIRQLQDLEGLGAIVVVVQADASDEARMRDVLRQIEARFGALHGVIYAAGISSPEYFGLLQELSVAQCEAHFVPKVYGLCVLERVFAGRQLDFCLLFSSLASVLGGLGMGAYAAANCFIDAFTRQHNRRDVQGWVTVNWDTWRTRQDQHEVLGATIAEYEMVPAEAVQAVERVVASGVPGQLVNSTGDLEARIDQWIRMVSIRDADGGTREAVLHGRPEMMTPYAAPESETEGYVAQVWESLLGIEPIGIHDRFLELGGNSLVGIQLVSRLRKDFQVNLGLRIIFDAPTVAEMALAIEDALIAEIEGLAEDEIET